MGDEASFGYAAFYVLDKFHIGHMIFISKLLSFIPREIMNGVAVYSEDGVELGYSQKAAYKSIVQVCTSRITMAAPGMCKCFEFRDSEFFLAIQCAIVVFHPCSFENLFHFL